MDSSMTSKKSANSKGSSRRPVGVTRQVSNVSARSRSTLSSGGSPKVARKGSTPVSRTETTSGRSPVGPKKLASSATIKQTRKTTDHTAAGQAIHAEKERSQDHLKPLSGVDKQTSLNLAKAKVNVGNRQTEKPKTNGTPNTKSGLSSRLSSGAETSVNKTSTPKERSEEKGEQLPLKRVTGRDINRSSARGKTIRSDSSDMDAASKLVSAKIYELRTELVNNSLITAPIKDFIGQGSVESFVVLPLGRFSQNSKSLWQAAMMELLLEIAVPKRRIFLDSSLIDLEKESLRSHAFVHRGDAGVPEDIEMLENTVRAPGPTLVFAPSPDVAAIEAIFSAYEEHNRLSELLIIGYSLHKLVADQASSSGGTACEPVFSAYSAPNNETFKATTLKRLLRNIKEETFPFDLFPQSAFSPFFAELRGYRVHNYSSSLAESGLRCSQDIRAASCDMLLTDRNGSNEDVMATSGPSGMLKAALSAPNSAPPFASRMPTALLTVGALCCGAGLAWMFINQR